MIDRSSHRRTLCRAAALAGAAALLAIGSAPSYALAPVGYDPQAGPPPSAAPPAQAPEPQAPSRARMTIVKERVDAGKVLKGEVARAVFEIKNTGEETLKILSATPG